MTVEARHGLSSSLREATAEAIVTPSGEAGAKMRHPTSAYQLVQTTVSVLIAVIAGAS